MEKVKVVDNRGNKQYCWKNHLTQMDVGDTVRFKVSSYEEAIVAKRRLKFAAQKYKVGVVATASEHGLFVDCIEYVREPMGAMNRTNPKIWVTIGTELKGKVYDTALRYDVALQDVVKQALTEYFEFLEEEPLELRGMDLDVGPHIQFS